MGFTPGVACQKRSFTVHFPSHWYSAIEARPDFLSQKRALQAAVLDAQDGSAKATVNCRRI